ncbi:Protein kinase domain-containing protein [Meloidogyne graminicola]|uniref:Protein kinase domain-containing protein n=1 Tax=Meloidogyne graminicola TaxID=189291 RepID=A0A8S9ZZK5_9BILA|nr:Protein kinase domain-containing protein [Meloidogyne graminicola]
MGQLKIPKNIGIWSVQALIGTGAFGSVFLVRTEVKTNKKFGYAAMKVEKRRKHREEEVLRMEVWVLSKLQGNPSFCTIYTLGQTSEFTFVVMTLLGKPVDDLRRMQPKRRFSTVTTLRIGIQLIKAFTCLHKAGFIHRDVKPANMAAGHKRPDIIYLFDFGLARFIYIDEAKSMLRPRRKKIQFRGTYRYCSLNAQKCMDQGRVDDLWGVLYTLIECKNRKLPWTGIKPKECQERKETITSAELLQNCPPSFARIMEHLQTLEFLDEPNYNSIVKWLNEDLQADPEKDNEFEWQRAGQSVFRIKSETVQTDVSLFTTLAASDEEDGSTVEYDDTIENMPPDKKIMNIEAIKAKQQKGAVEKEMTTKPPDNATKLSEREKKPSENSRK